MRSSSLPCRSRQAQRILERCRYRSFAFLHFGLTLSSSSSSSMRKLNASTHVSATSSGSHVPEPANRYLRHLMQIDHASRHRGDLGSSLMSSNHLRASADLELARVMQLCLDAVAMVEDPKQHQRVTVLRGSACAARWEDGDSGEVDEEFH